MSLPSVLKTIHGVRGWRDFSLTRTLSHEAQCYGAFDEVETVRCQGNVSYGLTVYVDSGKGRLGQSSLRFGADLSDLKQKVQRAVDWAAMVQNPLFELPEENDPALAREASIKAPPPGGVTHQFRRLADLTAAQRGVRLCQSEIWHTESLITVVNSRGLTLHEPRSDWFVDFTLLAGDPKKPLEEVEHWWHTHRRTKQALDLDTWVADAAHTARDLRRAVLPPSGKRTVILGGEALDTLFNFFTGQGSAQALFEGWTRFAIGKPVLAKMQGDPLTLCIDPTLPGAMGTRRFDGFGCLRSPFALIENNVFTQWLAPKPYADYAGVPATGEMSNLVVAPGTGKGQAWCKQEDALVLTSFSTFEPNDVTGAFSGEIRTGHWVKSGKRIPVKGGSLTGMVDTAFRRVGLSRETTQRERYAGPAWVCLGGVTVSGA